MRILRVITSMNPTTGGPCQGIRNSIPALQKLGCQNEVVCLDAPEFEFGSTPFVVHHLGPTAGPWKYSSKLLPWMRQHAREFDVMLLHGLWQYPSYAVSRLIREWEQQPLHRRPRVFAVPHGMLDPWFQQARSRRLKAYRNWWYWKLIENQIVSRADGLLFTCKREMELARAPFRPYRPKQEINIGYGVAAPPPETAAMRNSFLDTCPSLKGRPYFLFLSRIHPKKGVDILLRAYAEIAKGSADSMRLPDLVIAGPLDSSYASSMQLLARELGLESCPQKSHGVHFPGMLKGDAKWGAFYGCEAFVLPSHQENFGIAVVEALACGKAVLVSNQVNISPEIVSSGAGLAMDDSSFSLIRALKRWFGLSDQDRKAMEEKARGCYLDMYSADQAAQRLLVATRVHSHRLDA